MPIIPSEITFNLSGGASNTDANASLGGARSSNTITSGQMNNIFDNVSGAESAAGDTEYRCVYVRNTNGTLTLQNAVVWISANTPSTDTVIAIGLGTSAVNGTEQTVANENTAPSSVTFSSPSTEGTGISLGNIPAGQHRAVWIRRTVSAAAAAYNNDSFTLTVKGDTAA